MENVIFTQISTPELKQLFAETLETFFSEKKVQFPQTATEADEIGGIELAVEITGLAKPTIYSLVSQRAIPHSKPAGKKLYFRKSELLKWLMDGKRKTIRETADDAAQFLQDKKSKGKK